MDFFVVDLFCCFIFLLWCETSPVLAQMKRTQADKINSFLLAAHFALVQRHLDWTSEPCVCVCVCVRARVWPDMCVCGSRVHACQLCIYNIKGRLSAK